MKEFICPYCNQRYEFDSAMKDKSFFCSCGTKWHITTDEMVVDDKIYKEQILKNTETRKFQKIEDHNSDTFKEPILSFIYRIFAYIQFGIIGLIIIVDLITICFGIFTGFFSGIDRLLIVSLSINILLFVSGLIDFGIAQIITSIVKTAFNSDQIVKLLKEK